MDMTALEVGEPAMSREELQYAMFGMATIAGASGMKAEQALLALTAGIVGAGNTERFMRLIGPFVIEALRNERAGLEARATTGTVQ